MRYDGNARSVPSGDSASLLLRTARFFSSTWYGKESSAAFAVGVYQPDRGGCPAC